MHMAKLRLPQGLSARLVALVALVALGGPSTARALAEEAAPIAAPDPSRAGDFVLGHLQLWTRRGEGVSQEGIGPSVSFDLRELDERHDEERVARPALLPDLDHVRRECGCGDRPAFPHGPMVARVMDIVSRTPFGLLADDVSSQVPDFDVSFMPPAEWGTAPGDALRHPLRRAILDAIRASPGIGLPRLCATLDAPGGTLRYHLGILKKGGFVREDSLNGRTGFSVFAAGHAAARMGMIVRHPHAEAVLRALSTHPVGATLEEVATQAGISPNAAYHHLTRLAGCGIVHVEKHARALQYFAHPREEPLIGPGVEREHRSTIRE